MWNVVARELEGIERSGCAVWVLIVPALLVYLGLRLLGMAVGDSHHFAP